MCLSTLETHASTLLSGRVRGSSGLLLTVGLCLAAQGSSPGSSVGLEFLDPPQSPFLPQYVSGRHSPYGEGTLVLLRSLAQEKGLHCNQYAAMLDKFFGEGFDGYSNASITVRVSWDCSY
jgi:hypothetical protein